MDQNEKNFISKKLSDYYSNADFRIPEIERREFGIGNIKKIDARHLAFNNVDSYRAYLSNNPPLFTSHSAAYYDLPGATPITKKGWNGADLIFDLDLHAEGKYGVYKILDSAKQEVLRLVEDFLVQDFSIDRKDLAVVFSGNRGYHVHVRAKDYLPLGPEERRELIDYVNGNGLNYRNFFKREELKKGVIKLHGPKPTDSGYRGRFAREVLRFTEESPSKLSRKMAAERENFAYGINEGNWSRTSIPNLLERLSPVAETLPLRTINADAAVTYDVSKLIRVPNSIHGETGLIAKIVEDVQKFSPLDDAIAFEDGTIKVQLLEDVEPLEFGGTTTELLKKDDKKELPIGFGLFLVLKQSAKIIF